MNKARDQIAAWWLWFKSRSLEIRIGLITLAVAVIAIPVAFVASIPWDLYKESKANKEKAEESASEKSRHDKELNDRNLQRRKQLCDELRARFGIFQARINANDRTGAIRAFDTPAGRFQTTDLDLNSRDSRSLLKELAELSGTKLRAAPAEWPPDNESTIFFIQDQANAFMKDVDESCK
jgi:hypothetical protein